MICLTDYLFNYAYLSKILLNVKEPTTLNHDIYILFIYSHLTTSI